MSTVLKRLLAVAVVAAFAIGPAVGVKVQTDHNPEVSFSGLVTYRWEAKVPAAATDPTGQYRKLDKLVRETVDSELAARGYTHTEEKADFFVSYTAVTDPAMKGNLYYGQGWRVATVNSYAEGNLVIEFIDAKTNKAIWRGWAEGGVKPKQMDTRVPKAVKEILKRFPPPATP